MLLPYPIPAKPPNRSSTGTGEHRLRICKGAMYSPELLRHFRSPQNVGVLPEPAVQVRAENPVCGDVMVLSARIEGGAVREAAFQVRGCTASIAAGSAATCLLIGRTLEEARALSAADIETELGGLPSASKHAARLAEDAVRALLAKAEAAG